MSAVSTEYLRTGNQLFRRTAEVRLSTPKGQVAATAALGVNGGRGVSQTISIKDLRIRFRSMGRILNRFPNELELSITNCSPQTRAALDQWGMGTEVQVLAGYDGNNKTVFQGQVRTIDTVHHRADVDTVIKSGDAETARAYPRAIFSLPPGATVQAVVVQLAAAMGISTGNLALRVAAAGQPSLQQFVSGFSAHGNASRLLERMLAKIGLRYRIQNGALDVFAPGEGSLDTIFLLSPTSGLIGSPEHGSPNKRGPLGHYLKAKSLLLPEIQPRRRVQIDTQTIDLATYVVQQVIHTGDTEGPEWQSDMELQVAG